MASTTQTHNDLYSPPTLAAMSVNDDVTITGVHVSIARGRSYIRDAKIGNGKTFTLVAQAPKKINITRKT